MKVYLMHRDRDFDTQAEFPPNTDALSRDLGLDTLFGAMAGGDAFVLDVVKRAVLSSLVDPDAIVYRQDALRDCLDHPSVVREIYDVAVEAIEAEKKVRWGLFRDSPERILARSLRVLQVLASSLRRLREIADQHAGEFQSEGFVRFFGMLEAELTDEYLDTVDFHLRELTFQHGILISAELGQGNVGTRYVLRQPLVRSWVERLLGGHNRSKFSFVIPERDDNGFKALTELTNKGVNRVASAVAQSADHVHGFVAMLRAELAFYLGCLNLHEELSKKDEPTCFPVPVPSEEVAFTTRGLYDVCLALNVEARVVGNDVNGDGESLVMITGANQGGKSTFLRSVGLAELMMGSGMFAPAGQLRVSVSAGVFTHFEREEDPTMRRGKLEEELERMEEIAEAIRPGSLLLCNESFASTNEREGSEIARQIVRALLERGVKIFFVTHMFDLAEGFQRLETNAALFLRAERKQDGRRTFRMIEGEPLPTSYGEDLYRRIFGTSPGAAGG
ncbi:MAG: DNA mismatch repair protein MutS [Gammaproteobacteria bacterium]|nr:DNA mismatch repair protein MutS [Gammaproteobacteria bacterium]